MIDSDDTRGMQVYQPTTALTPGSDAGTLALASMSQEEFATRLATLKRGRERIAVIQRELMIEGVDYGVIPGTPKPTLYKSGAEKLDDFYQLRADFDSERTVGDGVTSPPISYKTRCLLHLGTLDGPVIGTGAGTANSWEKKHRYRTAELACPKCGCTGTILKSKQGGGWFCWAKKGGCGANFAAGDASIERQERGQIENADPWELDNTLCKMAEKRAFVNATLRTTASSGLFTQDLEDSVDEAPPMAAPTARGQDHEPQPEQRDELPQGNPGHAAKWFARQVALTGKLNWVPELVLENAKKLAIDLKRRGLSDADRAAAYRWLTAEESGREMSAAQLSVLAANAHRIEALRECAAAWREQQGSAAVEEG